MTLLHKLLLFFPTSSTSSSSIIAKPFLALRPIPTLFLTACLYATITSVYYEPSKHLLLLSNNNNNHIEPFSLIFLYNNNNDEQQQPILSLLDDSAPFYPPSRPSPPLQQLHKQQQQQQQKSSLLSSSYDYDPTFVESILPALTRDPLDDPTLQILDYNITTTNGSSSPYELRWPDWNLPSWARKEMPTVAAAAAVAATAASSHSHSGIVVVDHDGDNNTDAAAAAAAAAVVVPTSNKRTCFVHVGKAAGSTVGCALGFHLHCEKYHQQIAKDALWKYTTHTFHNSVNDCPDNASYYLFTMRDPLERFLSAFNYEHDKMQKKKAKKESTHNARVELYQNCPFPTLNDLAEQGLQSNGNASDTCKDRAKRAVLGLDRYGYHNYCNYRYYVNETLTNHQKQVLVIRNPYIAQDWMSAEAILAADEDEREGRGRGLEQQQQQQHRNNSTLVLLDAERLFPQRNKGRESSSKDSSKNTVYLSKASKTILCQYLCQEIQIYKWLLHKALNLNREQVEVSITELEKNCPVEARQDFCTTLYYGD